MYLDPPNNDVITESRIRWLIRFILLIIAVLVLRLFILQILQGHTYQSLAENNRMRLIRTRTPRGTVYDRNGIPLATNRRVFSIFFDPVGENEKEKEDSFQRLVTLLSQQKNELAEVLGRQASFPEKFKPRKLAEDVDFTTVSAIREQSLDLSGVYVKDEFIRYYPMGNGTAHIMGYLRGITVDELQKPQYEEYDLDDMVGRSGIEQVYEQQLRGTAGGWMIEVDARGRKRRDIGTITAMPGNSLVLNIDARLQQKAYELLGGKRGVIIAIDPNTGGILAMVREPSYNSNIMSGFIKSNEWAQIISDPGKPLENRAIQGTYPPGSVFKLLTALAGLENKKISPNTTFYCPGYYYLGSKAFKCHSKDGHGTLNLVSGITLSCNVYFYHAAQQVGLETMIDLAKQFGIGQPTGIDLLDEQKGYLPTDALLQKMKKEGWYLSETIQEGIGQGTVLATPLQIVNMVATIANGGIRYRPFLVKQIEDGSGKAISRTMPSVLNQIQVSPENFDVVRRGMWGVVNGGGTGGLARLPNIEVAGKTGTAEKPGEKDLAWFCGYAPFKKPEIVVLAMVEEGGFGGVAAAPLAREMFATYFNAKNPVPTPPAPKEKKPQQIAMSDKTR